VKRNSIITELYFEVIEKRENSAVSAECKYLQNKAFKADGEMMKALNGMGELEEKYRQVIDALGDFYIQSGKENFCEGFRMGVLLGLDISETENKN
jgi:hypothetical protein